MTATAPTAPVSDELANTGLRGVKRRPSGSDADARAQDGPAEGPETDLPIPRGELLGGRYLVERIFAEGGMGVVCFGRHAQLDQPVAIKFLRKTLVGKPAIVERFLNEGRALAALRSEHVVRVMDVGQLESGRPYLVMEHLEGIDLDTLVERDGPLDVETAIDYALQVCELLEEAHALGIVHRDIKPENLFLWSGAPKKPIIKVLDFGLAKQVSSPRALAVTGPQDSMGSPCYMSPEQITTPQNVDARTDIWSLGVVLHRLLTDGLPFDGNSILEVLSHVLSAPPILLREARPDAYFDAELESIVQRCLQKSADDRYASVDELAQALNVYLDHRRTGMASTLPPIAELAMVDSEAPIFEDDDAKIRIPGVRPRWPGVLVFLALVAGAAVYRADSTGRIHVREMGQGWLTQVHLGADVANVTRPKREHFGITTRGVIAAHAARDESGAPALLAVPEPERDVAQAEPRTLTDRWPTTPLSDAERARKEAAYREYLRSEGLTPLSEVLPTLDAPPSK